MTRIDFYIVDDNSPNGRQRFACRLAEKAYSQGHRVYIHTGDAAESEAIDQLLWTFRAGSFVPHTCLDDANKDDDSPVHIGHREEPHIHDDVLINLAEQVPLFFSRFHRVAEVISGDEAQRKQGRERYRFYRERGYPLETHTIANRRAS